MLPFVNDATETQSYVGPYVAWKRSMHCVQHIGMVNMVSVLCALSVYDFHHTRATPPALVRSRSTGICSDGIWSFVASTNDLADEVDFA